MPKKRKSSKGKKNILFRCHRMVPCHYCGAPLTRNQATLDHVKPLALGGYDRLRNCVIACFACNQKKGALTKEQFLAKQQGVAA